MAKASSAGVVKLNADLKTAQDNVEEGLEKLMEAGLDINQQKDEM